MTMRERCGRRVSWPWVSGAGRAQGCWAGSQLSDQPRPLGPLPLCSLAVRGGVDRVPRLAKGSQWSSPPKELPGPARRQPSEAPCGSDSGGTTVKREADPECVVKKPPHAPASSRDPVWPPGGLVLPESCALFRVGGSRLGLLVRDPSIGAVSPCPDCEVELLSLIWRDSVSVRVTNGVALMLPTGSPRGAAGTGYRPREGLHSGAL